nr:unnamed protein product [Spirometra erinaceieuropaei]
MDAKYEDEACTTCFGLLQKFAEMEKEIKGLKVEMEKLRNLPRYSSKENESERTYANAVSSAVSTDKKENISVHAEVCHHDDRLSACVKKTLAFEAISDLHAQLDGDKSGGVDLSEAEQFLKDKLSSPVDPRHQKDLSQNDGIISLFDLWVAWQRNPAHNWTVQDTIRWLGESVELPQYDQVFLLHNVDGETLPRLVMRNQTYLNDHLGVKNQFHRRKLVLKTMDLILFGPPKKLSASYKELSVITACAVGVFLLSFFCLNYHYTRKIRGRNTQAADGLYAAEQTLRELQQKLKEADPLSFNGRLTSIDDVLAKRRSAHLD